jgi:hypothetical protein
MKIAIPPTSTARAQLPSKSKTIRLTFPVMTTGISYINDWYSLPDRTTVLVKSVRSDGQFSVNTLRPYLHGNSRDHISLSNNAIMNNAVESSAIKHSASNNNQINNSLNLSGPLNPVAIRPTAILGNNPRDSFVKVLRT